MRYDRKDFYHQQAKRLAYRSRAAFKLLELDKKLKLIRPGDRLVDLGAWPGGWLQVASASVGGKGMVVGVDIHFIAPLGLDNVKLLRADVADDRLPARILELLGRLADVVLSDMAPKLSGIGPTDAARTCALAELSLKVATRVLRRGGKYLCKLFDSPDAEEFGRLARPSFRTSCWQRPSATRARSSEIYFFGRGFAVAAAGREGEE